MSTTKKNQGDAVDERNYAYVPTSTNFSARYAGPTQLTPEQETLRQSILASRPHTGLSGPFGPWLAVPPIANPSQQLGRVVRYETSLKFRESELVILLTGAKYKSEAEFDIHVKEARRAGVGWDVIHSIPRGKLLSGTTVGGRPLPKDEVEFSLENVKKCMIPMLENEHEECKVQVDETDTTNIEEARRRTKEREVSILLFAAELLDRSTVTDETYAQTKEVLGDDSVLVEITAIIGYYAYVGMTLNVFRIPSAMPPMS